MQGLKTRMATKSDAAFLARMDYEASLPPFDHSFWDDLVEPTGSKTLTFLETMFRSDASNWGKPDDFIIIEREGSAVACCAVFCPPKTSSSSGPLILDRLNIIARQLDWTLEAEAAFRAKYLQVWGDDSDFLAPQADAIIETVAVLPNARGLGLGHVLMEAAFERGISIGAGSIGIMAINGNDTAISLYDKHFDRFATYHAAYFDHEFPGLTKFRKILPNQKETGNVQKR